MSNYDVWFFEWLDNEAKGYRQKLRSAYKAWSYFLDRGEDRVNIVERERELDKEFETLLEQQMKRTPGRPWAPIAYAWYDAFTNARNFGECVSDAISLGHKAKRKALKQA